MCRKNEEPRKTGKNQQAQARTVVRAGRTAVRLPPRAVLGPTVSPWWPLPSPVPIFLECRILSYFGPRDVPWILPALGMLGLLCYSLHLAWFQIMPFSNKLDPNHANLQLQLNKVKTEHNWRNTCLNRKLMQSNPKFQAKNHQKYPCIFTHIS